MIIKPPMQVYRMRLVKKKLSFTTNALFVGPTNLSTLKFSIDVEIQSNMLASSAGRFDGE